MLLAEYGFIHAAPKDGERGNAYNHLQIDQQVVALFAAHPQGDEKKETLQERRYWG